MLIIAKLDQFPIRVKRLTVYNTSRNTTIMTSCAYQSDCTQRDAHGEREKR